MTLGIRLTADEMEKLEKCADETFRKKSDVVRFALKKFFEEEEEKKTEKDNEAGN